MTTDRHARTAEGEAGADEQHLSAVPEIPDDPDGDDSVPGDPKIRNKNSLMERSDPSGILWMTRGP
jgi:hypothetical protein